jgi:hypothetical protein
MRSDSDIKRDLEDELRWDPDLDATDIAVTVKSGVVTFAGFTRSRLVCSRRQTGGKPNHHQFLDLSKGERSWLTGR